jgi:3-mercaptopyruvate sulfurtransferase SseA
MFTWMKQSKLSLLLALILAVGLLVGGCGGGSDSYDDHTIQRATKTATPLISVDKLKSWIDAGLVNSGYMADNVVVLHIGNQADAKIPGAHYWLTNEIRQTRIEGLAEKSAMVSTGETMDEVLQRSGVNELSTIVVSAPRSYEATLAYFTLRYWGFPKEKIKVVDGFNPAWDTAYGLTTDFPEEVVGNTFSVKSNGTLRADLRYSIGEIIEAVDTNVANVAASTDIAYNILPNGPSFYVLSTSIRDTLGDPIAGQSAYFTPEGLFKSPAEIQAVLDTYDGFNSDLPIITHCGSGLSCTPIFFALDALMGLNIGVWDGSSGQWAQYRGDAAGGDLTIDDDWNVNLLGRSLAPAAANTSSIIPFLNLEYQIFNDVTAPEFNQLETQDEEYMSDDDGASGGGSAPTPGGDVITPC